MSFGLCPIFVYFFEKRSRSLFPNIFIRERKARDFFFQSNKTIILEYFLKNFTSLKEEIDWGEYFVFAFVCSISFFFFINNKLFSTIESLYCLLRYVRKCISLSEKEISDAFYLSFHNEHNETKFFFSFFNARSSFWILFVFHF